MSHAPLFPSCCLRVEIEEAFQSREREKIESKLDRVQAQAAAFRQTVDDMGFHESECAGGERNHASAKAILSSDDGKGWKSPEEVGRMEKELEALKEVEKAARALCPSVPTFDEPRISYV